MNKGREQLLVRAVVPGWMHVVRFYGVCVVTSRFPMSVDFGPYERENISGPIVLLSSLCFGCQDLWRFHVYISALVIVPFLCHESSEQVFPANIRLVMLHCYIIIV